MYKIFYSEKDNYITNKIIDGERCLSSNVGKAGTLDLYKLYGETIDDEYEYSRGLIKFDIENLKNDFLNGKIDIESEKFECRMKLFDAYGGQTTPDNFSLKINCLNKDFEEGVGRDVVFYQDQDSSNFISCSYGNAWNLPGASSGGNLGDQNIDYIISGNIGNGQINLTCNQLFKNGDENLDVNITDIIKGVLLGALPDNGFRISFIDEQEQDQKTRFVKRFATKDAADSSYHPQLIVKYDDSIRSDNKNFYFDNEGRLYLFNKIKGSLKNISIGGNQITGSNCLKLVISSGSFEETFSASQYSYANNLVNGIYYCDFSVFSNDQNLLASLEDKNELTFQVKWTSNDDLSIFFKEELKIKKSELDSISENSMNFIVTSPRTSNEYKRTDVAKINIHIENIDDPYVSYTKVPLISPSYIPEKVYYSIRDSYSGRVIIPFDDVNDATRLSNDSESLWFYFPMSNLTTGFIYEIDIMIVIGETRKYYRNICAPFKISSDS